MAESTEAATLEEQGLVAISYDAFFSIDTRIRKIDTISLTRQGFTPQQFAAFGITAFAVLMILALVVVPLLNLVGLSMSWQMLLISLIGLPALAGWAVMQPMPSGKSLFGTITSWVRFRCDDTEHRRGVPVPPSPRSQTAFVQHLQREWVMYDEVAVALPDEMAWTDPVTAAHKARAVGHVDYQTWLDAKAVAHWNAAQDAATTKSSDRLIAPDRRGTPAAAEI